jgi:hypothetical protein
LTTESDQNFGPAHGERGFFRAGRLKPAQS